MFGKIYHSRQACPANLITYGLVPEQIVTQKKNNWVFLKGGRSLRLKRISTFLVEILDHRSPWGTVDPNPTACDFRSRACDPLSHPIFGLWSPFPYTLSCNPVTESSVRATVSKMARMFWRCPHEVINIEIAAVSYLNVDRPRAAIIVGKTDLPGDQAFSYSGVIAVQPTSRMRVASVARHAWSWHFGPCGRFKSVPSK